MDRNRLTATGRQYTLKVATPPSAALTGDTVIDGTGTAEWMIACDDPAACEMTILLSAMVNTTWNVLSAWFNELPIACTSGTVNSVVLAGIVNSPTFSLAGGP